MVLLVAWSASGKCYDSGWRKSKMHKPTQKHILNVIKIVKINFEGEMEKTYSRSRVCFFVPLVVCILGYRYGFLSTLK